MDPDLPVYALLWTTWFTARPIHTTEVTGYVQPMSARELAKLAGVTVETLLATPLNEIPHVGKDLNRPRILAGFERSADVRSEATYDACADAPRTERGSIHVTALVERWWYRRHTDVAGERCEHSDTLMAANIAPDNAHCPSGCSDVTLSPCEIPVENLDAAYFQIDWIGVEYVNGNVERSTYKASISPAALAAMLQVSVIEVLTAVPAEVATLGRGLAAALVGIDTNHLRVDFDAWTGDEIRGGLSDIVVTLLPDSPRRR